MLIEFRSREYYPRIRRELTVQLILILTRADLALHVNWRRCHGQYFVDLKEVDVALLFNQSLLLILNTQCIDNESYYAVNAAPVKSGYLAVIDAE